MSIKDQIKSSDGFTFGLWGECPDDAPVAWGARAISDSGCGFSLLPDRQSWAGPKELVDAFSRVLNQGPIKHAIEVAKRLESDLCTAYFNWVGSADGSYDSVPQWTSGIQVHARAPWLAASCPRVAVPALCPRAAVATTEPRPRAPRASRWRRWRSIARSSSRRR